MPLSTELREALARSRRRLRLRGGTVNQEGGTRAPLLQENSDTVPAEDPDDFIDPTRTAAVACQAAQQLDRRRVVAFLVQTGRSPLTL